MAARLPTTTCSAGRGTRTNTASRIFCISGGVVGGRLRWTTMAEGGRREAVERDGSALAKLGRGMTDTALVILMVGIAASHLCMNRHERDNDDDKCYDDDDNNEDDNDDDNDNDEGGGWLWLVLTTMPRLPRTSSWQGERGRRWRRRVTTTTMTNQRRQRRRSSHATPGPVAAGATTMTTTHLPRTTM
jgi:hypothetical protein